MRYGLTFFIFIITAMAIAVFSWTAVHALWYAPDVDAKVPEQRSRTTASQGDAPVRLIIPALAIDAHVQEVGINGKGNMAVPSNYTDVAWYKYGPTPGEIGSAVIGGHVDNALGLAGVFKRLEGIQIGDDIYIDTKSGKRLHFIVRNVESYHYTQVPTELLFNLDDTARLNLVTCGGSWVKEDETYSQRLVVYTELKAS